MEWESALLYSRADTLDTGYNRIRVSALQQAINSTNIEEAYNPFIGGNPENVNNGTSVYNSAAVIAGLTEDITRDSTSELAQWDFKLSNPALANWYAGDIGIAAGLNIVTKPTPMTDIICWMALPLSTIKSLAN